MTSFDVLTAEIKVSLPDVSDIVVKAALVRAAMIIVDKAKLIRHKITQDFFSGVKDYPVELPDCMSALRIDTVKLNGEEVDFEETDLSWVAIDKEVCNIPDSINGLEIYTYSGISRRACEIPTPIYDRYGHVIIDMALSRLYGMYGEEWYDPNLVKFFGGIGKGGIDDAKQDSLEQQALDGIEIDTDSFIL